MISLADAGVRQTILDRIAKVTPASKRQWGRMTAHEMICHLNDSFGLALGGRQASMASGVFQRTFMKWFALNVPIKWPKGIATRPEMEQGAAALRRGNSKATALSSCSLLGASAMRVRVLRRSSIPSLGSCGKTSGCAGAISTLTIIYGSSAREGYSCSPRLSAPRTPAGPASH